LAGVLGAAALAAGAEDTDLFWYHQPPKPAKTIPATATAVIMFFEAISDQNLERYQVIINPIEPSGRLGLPRHRRVHFQGRLNGP
jgi:hypothetical protein